jgi:hypothetical protein
MITPNNRENVDFLGSPYNRAALGARDIGLCIAEAEFIGPIGLQGVGERLGALAIEPHFLDATRKLVDPDCYPLDDAATAESLGGSVLHAIAEMCERSRELSLAQLQSLLVERNSFVAPIVVLGTDERWRLAHALTVYELDPTNTTPAQLSIFD